MAALEDVLYGTESPTADVFDQEDAALMQKEFDRAQGLKEMSLTPGFKDLSAMVAEAADSCIQREIAYSGTDKNKAEKLRMDRICAIYARDFLRITIENAVDTPRPVLQKAQQ
jgi:hypothetical protein